MSEIAIGNELRCLNNMIRRAVESSAVLEQAEKLTGANSRFIAYLADHRHSDVFQRDLEKQFSITRSTASKIIKLMEQKGLVERHGVAGDARLKKLVLTDKAMALHEAIMADFQQLEARLTRGFCSEDLAVLTASIERMKQNMGEA